LKHRSKNRNRGIDLVWDVINMRDSGGILLGAEGTQRHLNPKLR